MISKTIKFEQSDIDMVQQRAVEDGCSASEVMRRAVRAYCGGNTDGKTGHDDGASAVLAAQQRQIDTLTRLLDQSQQLQLMALNRQLPEGKTKKSKKAKKGKKARKGIER